MTNRINPYAVPGNPVGPFNEFALSREGKGSIERSVIELVKIRASQINGCAMCLSMHTRDARKAGETETRSTLLPAGRDATRDNERERAAWGWTEALTHMDHRAMDDAYVDVTTQFTPEEQVQLNLAIGIINVYNRLNAGFGVKPPVAAEDRRAA